MHGLHVWVDKVVGDKPDRVADLYDHLLGSLYHDLCLPDQKLLLLSNSVGDMQDVASHLRLTVRSRQVSPLLYGRCPYEPGYAAPDDWHNLVLLPGRATRLENSVEGKHEQGHVQIGQHMVHRVFLPTVLLANDASYPHET